MKSPAQWSLRLRVFLFFALIAAGAVAMIAAALWLAAGRIGAGAAAPLVLFGGAAGFGIVLLTGWVWRLFDENVARPIQAMTGELSATVHARGRPALSAGRARYLGDLGPAAERLAETLAEARGAAGEAASAAAGEVLEEKARLEAVLRDLSECVLICNANDEILLYNAEARRLLCHDADIGLGRSIFGFVSERPVRHALDRLEKRVRSGRYLTHRDGLGVAVVCATRDGRRTLQGRITLLLEPGGTRIDGFVATFRDATDLIEAEAARDHLLSRALEDLRRPAATLRVAGEVMAAGPLPPGERARVEQVIDAETARLAETLDALGRSVAGIRVGGWTMSDVSSEAIAACAADRLAGPGAPRLVHAGPRVWLNCDSFTVVELVARAAEEIGREGGAGEVRLAATPSRGRVHLDLEWAGPPAGFPERDAWLDAPLADALPAVSARDVLAHHRTALWAESAGGATARVRLPLSPAVEDHETGPATEPGPRPEFYDFALLRRTAPPDIRDTPLAETVFTVFDTETTGLSPSGGDEIVQIAGVRVLNGRIIPGESFDRLVNPKRPIPAAATRIHGITDAMVADAAGAETVLAAFHDFAAGSVLVAHNAPFDMAFLGRKEAAAGRAFDQPVLDTVLLSAWLFGQGETHTLDALAARFGVELPDRLRHTAIGDATATAEALCGLIGALSERGVVTLGDALRVSESAGAIRRRQAGY